MTVEKTAKKRMLSTISWLNSGIPESMSSYADHGVRMKNPTTDAHTVSCNGVRGSVESDVVVVIAFFMKMVDEAQERAARMMRASPSILVVAGISTFGE